MSSVGRCRLCGEDVPFIVGNPVELGFHMIDRHSAGSVGQYSIDDANQLYKNTDFPESSGLSFEYLESRSGEVEAKPKEKKKRRKHEKKHKKTHFDEEDAEESDEEHEEEEEEEDEEEEEKELKQTKSRHRKPKKDRGDRQGCVGNKKKRGPCYKEEDKVEKVGCRGDRYDGSCRQPAMDFKENRPCGYTMRRSCEDADNICGGKQRRSRKRFHKSGLYKTSIEMWSKAGGSVTCPSCNKTVKPLIRNHKTKVAYTSIGAAFMLGFWPICFLFPFMHQCSVDLFCSNCKQPLAPSAKRKTNVHVPNIQTTD